MSEVEKFHDTRVPPEKSNDDHCMPPLMRVSVYVKPAWPQHFGKLCDVEEGPDGDKGIHNSDTGKEHGNFRGDAGTHCSPMELCVDGREARGSVGVCVSQSACGEEVRLCEWMLESTLKCCNTKIIRQSAA